MIKAFTKIFSIGDDRIINIFDDEVEITEKIDGSQFNCGKIDGEFFIRSKGKQIFYENYDKMFKEAVEYVWSIKDRFPDNITFHMEYLKKPKHNVLVYNRFPKNHLIMFGMSTAGGTFYNKDAFLRYTDYFDIETVPVLYKGKINHVDEIKKLLDRESVLGGTKIEGIVVKNYHKAVDFQGIIFPIMCGKFVSAEFKEVHQRDWKKEHTGQGKFETLKQSYRTEARWSKAIQHLRERGELTNTPKDIGSLLKELNLDIIEEEKENIKEELWKIFGKDILKTVASGLPEYYKELLLKRSFE